MNRVQTDAQKLASEYNEEKSRLERRMHELAESARQEAERAAAEHDRHLNDLQGQLNRMASESVAQREALIREIEELQRHPPRGAGFFGMIGRAIDGIFGIHSM
jgi:ElaB/YqjD/DUF883 family membrane-anchored ribosome-binding protein